MRTTPLLPGHYYHIYNRGVNKGAIFFQRENWTFFLRRLRQNCRPERAEVLAYCLMPNHYHLLVHLKCEDFSYSVMQPFNISYTKAINEQQGRVGALFQGPFQARLVEHDADLLNLSRYIHLNPVRAGLVQTPEAWEHSSYRDYIGLRAGALPVVDFILSQFPSRQTYAEFVCDPRDDREGLADSLLID